MILLSSSVNEVLFIAFRLSSNCPTELAPIMTEVTKSSFSTHANAISAKVLSPLFGYFIQSFDLA